MSIYINLSVEERIVLIDELNHEQVKKLVHDILEEDISSRSEVTELENDVTTLEETVRDLENEVTELENAVKEKDEKITALQEEAENLRNTVAEQAKQLEECHTIIVELSLKDSA